jgi:hypothetical protein
LDERLAKYLLYTRKNLFGEPPGIPVVRRFESADLLNWQNEVFVMQADEIDKSSYAPPTPQPRWIITVRRCSSTRRILPTACM